VGEIAHWVRGLESLRGSNRSEAAFQTECGRRTGSRTRARLTVKAPDEEHTVTVAKVLSWLDGVASSPSEKLKKNRLRGRLRKCVHSRLLRRAFKSIFLPLCFCENRVMSLSSAALVPQVLHLKKRAFLAAFSGCGSICQAPKRAKVDRRTYYTMLSLRFPCGDCLPCPRWPLPPS